LDVTVNLANFKELAWSVNCSHAALRNVVSTEVPMPLAVSSSGVIASATDTKSQRERSMVVAGTAIEATVRTVAILEIFPASPVLEWPGRTPHSAFNVT
jgi:hypothetical protein